MVKVMGLIKRKPGLSREEFAKHYEEVHAPLALNHFPTFVTYRRNHIIRTSSSPSDEEPEFDCITEITYKNMKDYQRAHDFWESEAAQFILKDNESFMDTSKMVFFLVEETVSKMSR